MLFYCSSPVTVVHEYSSQSHTAAAVVTESPGAQVHCIRIRYFYRSCNAHHNNTRLLIRDLTVRAGGSHQSITYKLIGKNKTEQQNQRENRVIVELRYNIG